MSSERGKLVIFAALGLGILFTAYIWLHVWRHVIGRGAWVFLGDFRLFYAAASVVAHGGDPYRLSSLIAAEPLRGHFPPTTIATTYVNPPALAFLLTPFTHLHFVAAYAVFTAIGIGAIAVTVVALAKELGWRGAPLLAVGALTWAVTTFGLAVGQLDALLLAATLGAMVLVWRQHWLFAGLLLGLFWLKPDILWPVLFCLGVGIWPDRRALVRYAVGIASGALVLIALDAPRLPDWFRSLRAFEHAERLNGLLAEVINGVRLPAHLHSATFIAVTAVAVLAVLAVTLWLVRSRGWSALGQRQQLLWLVGLGLAVWLTLTPYSFPNDDLLLLPLLVAMLGPDASRAAAAAVALAILAMAVVLPLDNVAANWLPAGPNSLVLALVAIAGCYTYSKNQGARSAVTHPISPTPAPTMGPSAPTR